MTSKERMRATLLRMYMSDLGFERAACVDSTGALKEPRLFYEALPVVYADLGPEGLDELTKQSGVDVFGNEKD